MSICSAKINGAFCTKSIAEKLLLCAECSNLVTSGKCCTITAFTKSESEYKTELAAAKAELLKLAESIKSASSASFSKPESEYKTELAAANTRLEQLAESVKSSATSFSKAESEYKVELAAAKAELQKLNSSVVGVFDDATLDLPKLISAMKNIVKTAGGDPDKVDVVGTLVASSVTTSALNSQIADLKEQVIQLKKDATVLKKAKAQQSADNAALTERSEILGKLMGGVLDKIGAVDRKPSTFTAVFDGWFTTNTSSGTEITRLQSELAKATIEITRLNDNDIVILKEEVRKLTEAKQKIAENLQQKDRAHRSAEDSRALLRTENDALKGEVEALKAEIDAFTPVVSTINVDDDI